MSRSSYWGEAVIFIKQRLPSHFKMLKSQFSKESAVNNVHLKSALPLFDDI